jgi:hypothetical protein
MVPLFMTKACTGAQQDRFGALHHVNRLKIGSPAGSGLRKLDASAEPASSSPGRAGHCVPMSQEARSSKLEQVKMRLPPGIKVSDNDICQSLKLAKGSIAKTALNVARTQSSATSNCTDVVRKADKVKEARSKARSFKLSSQLMSVDDMAEPDCPFELCSLEFIDDAAEAFRRGLHIQTLMQGPHLRDMATTPPPSWNGNV